MNSRFPPLLSMAAAAVALLSALMLTGCQKSVANTEQQASTHPVSGGSLTWGVTTEPVCFDPHQASQQNAFFLIRNFVDSLIAKKADGSYGPWLAKSWQVSADGKRYTFVVTKRGDGPAARFSLDAQPV